MSRAIVPAALLAAVSGVYLLRLDAAAGLFVDDAWYIVLAQSIAQGSGFRLISSATTPILPAFPPGFPLLLAPIVGVMPSFPGNVAALKAVSMVAMLGIGAGVFWHLSRQRSVAAPVAAVVALITMLLPAFVFLATSTVMAEIVFTLGQLAVVLAVERAARADRATPAVVGSGVLAGATLLIRAAGMAVAAASILYLWHRRGLRTALLFAAVTAACYTPWLVYAAANRGNAEDHARHGGPIASRYIDLLQRRIGAESDPGRAHWTELPARIGGNILNIAGRDVGALIVPAVYRGPAESGQEVFGMSGDTGFRASSMGGATATVAASLVLSAIALAGFAGAARRQLTVAELTVAISLAMIALVPALTFRYVLPLAPFIVFYFLCGVEVVTAFVLRAREWAFGAPFRIASACVVALLAAEHFQYVRSMHSETPPVWVREHAEVTALTGWLAANLSGEGGVASNNPGLVYLTTGRRGVSMGGVRENWPAWRQLGIRYGVAVHPADKPSAAVPARLLHEAAHGRRWVVEFTAAVDRK